MAQEIFMERGKATVGPLTKFDLYFEKDMFDELDEPGDSPIPHNKQIDKKVFYTDRMRAARPPICWRSARTRSVGPFRFWKRRKAKIGMTCFRKGVRNNGAEALRA